MGQEDFLMLCLFIRFEFMKQFFKQFLPGTQTGIYDLDIPAGFLKDNV